MDISLQELVDLLKGCHDMGMAYAVSETDQGLLIEVLSEYHGIVQYHISKAEILNMSGEDLLEINRNQGVRSVQEYLSKISSKPQS